jgi:hypothetical protein
MTHAFTTLAQASNDAGGMVFMVIVLALLVLVIAGFWKVFTKAGQPGWAAIVPIFNLYILLKIAGRPWWWLILFVIPIVSIIVTIIVSIDVAKSFGKGVVFGIGLALLAFIFYPILGFGDAEYQGPAAG